MAFDFYGITSCCTGRLFENIPNWSQFNKDQKLVYLKRIKTAEHPKAKDSYAVFIMILTHTQLEYNTEFLEKLGWQHVFLGSKDHDSHRHPETGDLHVYCVKPIEFYANLDKYITELTPVVVEPTKITPEEVQRRQGYMPLTIRDLNAYSKTSYTLNHYFPSPTSITGRSLAASIKHLTGGFDVTTIPQNQVYDFNSVITYARAWRLGKV